jgi:hypothetical protein
MSFKESSISVSRQQTPQRKQRINVCYSASISAFLRASACCLQKTQVQQFCPYNVSKRDAGTFAVSVRNVLNKASFSEITLSDVCHLHVNYHCTVFQVQVHVFSQKGFGAVQAKAFHWLIAPSKLFICYVAPALFTYGQFFAFKLNVKLDVPAFAVVFPRILTMFHGGYLSHVSVHCVSRIAFKIHVETTV